MADSALPKGSLFVVTGVNGFIASHVADQLLQRGYKVRGTVRDVNKWQWLHERFEKAYGKDVFELACVPDFTAPKALHDAVKGASGVAHVASVVSLDADPDKVIAPTVTATMRALEAAADTPSVKSFVFTSSTTAILVSAGDVKHEINRDTWNTESAEIVRSGADRPDMGLHVYAVSKLEAEQSVWRFQKEQQPHFTVNVVVPDLTLGPLMHPTLQPGSTAGWALGIYTGTDNTTMTLIPPHHFNDVRDTALLHVAGLVLPQLNGERLFGMATPYNFNGFLKLLKKIDPSREYRAPLEDNSEDLSVIDTARTEEVLRLIGKQGGWTTMEQSMRDAIASIQ